MEKNLILHDLCLVLSRSEAREEAQKRREQALPQTLVRVWWHGPIQHLYTDGRTMVTGEYQDMPASTPVAPVLTAKRELHPNWLPLNLLEASGGKSFVYRGLPGGVHGGLFHWAYVETEVEGLRRRVAELEAEVAALRTAGT